MNLRIALLSVIALLLTGCGGFGNVCNDAEYYESSRLNEPIDVPDDLDGLSEETDLEVPESAPRDRTVAEGKCLESPPPIQSST